jgi:AcrR family transcriptional regulator
MGRTVKSRDIRMDEILDVAYALFLEHGYANTPVQKIIDRVGIAKGTFYHHYRSKSDLLDGLARRTVAQSLAAITPLVDDPSLTPIEKLRELFGRIVAWKAEQREFVLGLIVAMNREGNALLRQRLEQAGRDAGEPLLRSIIEQGVAEGVFRTRFPGEVAHIVLRISQSQSECFQRRLLAGERGPEVLAELERELAAHYDAIEKVLGAPRGSLEVFDRDSLASWLALGMEEP